MSALLDVLREMGMGEQAVAAAALVLVAMYLFRGKKWAATVAGLVGQVWLVGMGLAVSLAAAIMLNWVDPNPAEFVGDAITLGRVLVDTVSGPLIEWLREAVGA